MARNIARPDAPGIGHNSLSEDQFFHHLAVVVAAKAKVDAARAELNGVRKLARGAGVVLGLLDRNIKRSTMDPDEVREEIATDQRYATWMRLPIGTQLDLLEGVPMAARPAIDWQSKGFLAATTGKGAPGTPPPECPPDQIQAWMLGWSEGQARNAPSKLKDAEQAAWDAAVPGSVVPNRAPLHVVT